MKFNNKGFFFTIGTILLIIIPLLLLITFYTETSKMKSEDTIGKIRCDEIHYLVEDVKTDLKRAAVIFGRRAAIYAMDYAVINSPLENYTFICNSFCGVDCGRFSYSNNGSQAAIAELILCGTINGTNVSYMLNHTMNEWTNRTEIKGTAMNVVLNITTTAINIVQTSPWEFTTIIDAKLKVSDREGMCFYGETPIKVMANTSIIGLEDPLFTLNSKGRVMRYIENCDATINIGPVIANGNKGWGNATGRAVFWSDFFGSEGTFCSTTSNINDIVLVIDQNENDCDKFELDCYNASSTHHFAGVINEKNVNSNNFENRCKITIPWIKGTGDLGVAGLSAGNCTWMKEAGHEVIMGISSDMINTSCFIVSNVTEYGGLTDGPSFFDRLDGRYELSEKYVNQSIEYFNQTLIGMETLVDEYNFAFHLLPVYLNATWVDYLYWQKDAGYRVCGVCKSLDGYQLRLDEAHADMYGVAIGCYREGFAPIRVKRDLPKEAEKGDRITVRLIVKLDKYSTITSAIIKDNVPTGWNLVSSNPVADSFDFATGEITWTLSGAGLKSQTIKYKVDIPNTESTGAKAFLGNVSYTQYAVDYTEGISGDQSMNIED